MIFDEISKEFLEQHLNFFTFATNSCPSFCNMPYSYLYEVYLSESSEELFHKAMQSDNPDIHYYLGCFFSKEQLHNETLALWHKAAEANHKKAKYNLGFIYYYGQCGVEENKEKGMQYWKESEMPTSFQNKK